MKQYPDQFGRSPLYSNPEGTLPMPSPKEVPRPQWYGAKMPFLWTGVISGATPNDAGPPGILFTYAWTSPVFDLRPDLRSAQAGPKQGNPIWSTAARLYVQIFGGDPQSLPLTQPFPVTTQALDFGQTTVAQSQTRAGEGIGTPPNVVLIGSTDATSKFAPTAVGQESSIAGFSPPGTVLGFGDGYPIRYWRLKIHFSLFIETGFPIPPVEDQDPETLVLQAAVY